MEQVLKKLIEGFFLLLVLAIIVAAPSCGERGATPAAAATSLPSNVGYFEANGAKCFFMVNTPTGGAAITCNWTEEQGR